MQLFIGIVLVLSPAISVFLGLLFFYRWRTRVRMHGEGSEFERLRRILS